MVGSSSKDFECITSGYPLRDYQVCITKEIFCYSAKSKSYKLFYTQGVRCVCGKGGGGLLRKEPVQISNWAVVFHYSWQETRFLCWQTWCITVLSASLGVVGWGKGVVYLASPGVQLILAYSWARPAVLAAGKVEGDCFYFFCFFTIIHFHFSLVPSLSSPLLSLLSLFSLSLSPFLWETTNKIQNEPQMLTCR